MSDRPRGSDNENDDRCGGQYPVAVGIIEASNFMDELMYIVVDAVKDINEIHCKTVPIIRLNASGRSVHQQHFAIWYWNYRNLINAYIPASIPKERQVYVSP